MRSSIPTPTLSQIDIGPLTFHIYALCIIAGIAIAIWLGDRRLRSYGNSTGVDLSGVVSEVAVIAVPAGIIGGRLYHVVTTPELYFGSNGDLLTILKIWQGGLGIWGAIALGVLGAFISYRRIARGKTLPSFRVFLDALAPGLLLAQAIGRFGNWFNAELFGRPLDTWWALEIPYKFRPRGYGLFETFHPTFLYEALWTTLLAALLIKFGGKLKGGSTFYIYVAGYSLARFFIEAVRIDSAHDLLGLRINQWTSIFVFILGMVLIYRNQGKKKV
ncbi:MAG: prolipoprotein diacylglyceryl transferase [Actinobacteria bacterium]|nr:prolipoprotein diacylglyceryl transferase [Actinomycetota bacterium]